LPIITKNTHFVYVTGGGSLVRPGLGRDI